MKALQGTVVAAGLLWLPFSSLIAQEPPPTRRDPQPQVRYPLGVDSLANPGVPRGRLEGPHLLHSKIIADTVRKYWVYVPAHYDPQVPACLLVFQDGARAIDPAGVLRVPNVLDNLIAKKQIPITIGLFITPGQRGDEFPDSIGTGNPNNRDREYDVLDDTYARMLIDELIPEVEKKYKLTADPAGRVIGGSSSGAICAFTVAWERPDQFRNVVSMIGSYTDIHGGHVYPDLVRKADKKPIRIFLQDGEHDLRNPAEPNRDWYLQNQKMVAALEDKGYDMAHVFGQGGHSDDHGGAMLPHMLRWIWRDYPGVEPPATDLVADASAIQPELEELFPGFDANASVDPSGTFTWERRFGNTRFINTLNIEVTDGNITGTYASQRGDAEPTSTEILDPVMQGNKLVLDVTQSFRGREVRSTLQGIVTDRGITGWRLMSFGGQARDVRWEARRARTENSWGLLKRTDDTASWQFEVAGEAEGAMSAEAGAIIFKTTKNGRENWHVQAYQPGIPLTNGKTYEVSFTAKSSESGSTILAIGTVNQPNWHGIGLREEIYLSESFRVYTFTFTARDVVSNNNRIGFMLGEDEGTFFIENMSVVEK